MKRANFRQKTKTLNTAESQERIEFSRSQRKAQTYSEQVMWEILRNRGVGNAKFRRQFPFGPYTLDFYCMELRLAIECDGAPHFTEAGKVYDADRDSYLRRSGVTVLRFENQKLESDSLAVREEIFQLIKKLRECET